ncbi:MAG: DNA repair protein RecN [Saprospirales bacterium]|nr:MAG: DNA repair protein RecN [Saprospirales bacterium]
MLKSLTIKNYAIIDHLNFNPGEGLNVLTGETGAGKSILLGALGLVLGNRADLNVLRDPEKKCVVEADFDISKYDLKDFFLEQDLDFHPILTVRREILPVGKSRAFVNDSPVRLDLLNRLTTHLVDLHQQFASLDIYRRNYQLSLLDAMAENRSIRRRYSDFFQKWQESRSKLEELMEVEREAGMEQDFIRFQFEEINELNPQAGELEELESQLSMLENFENIKLGLSRIDSTIEGSPNSLEILISDLLRELQPLSHCSKEISDFTQRLQSVRIELSEISREANMLNDQLEYQPEELGMLKNRLDEMNRLLKKHRLDTSEQLIELSRDLEERLKKYSSVADEIEDLKSESDELFKTLRKEGKELSDSRAKAARKIEEEACRILKDLAMPNARLKIELSESDEPQPDGLDRVRLMFSANKGMGFRDLKEVASGGEISRLNLAIKSLIAGKIQLPTLIFDEIDSGVSGDVALRMGRIMKKTALSHQLIVITHSPQVAACAQTHFYIHKSNEEEKTSTRLRQLKEEDRMHYVAVMLSSDPPGAAAVENARELLQTK